MDTSFNTVAEIAALNRRIGILERVDDFIRLVRPLIQGDYTLGIINAGDKFIRIGMFREEQGRAVGLLSVHAFVDRETGEVYKAASLLAPARGVRYEIATDDGLRQIVAVFDQEGTYLYNIKRNQNRMA
jgi:hypothetical protein